MASHPPAPLVRESSYIPGILTAVIVITLASAITLFASHGSIELREVRVFDGNGDGQLTVGESFQLQVKIYCSGTRYVTYIDVDAESDSQDYVSFSDDDFDDDFKCERGEYWTGKDVFGTVLSYPPSGVLNFNLDMSYKKSSSSGATNKQEGFARFTIQVSTPNAPINPSVSVPADIQWTFVGTLTAGQSFCITATGTWSMDSVRYVGPDGSPEPASQDYPLPGANKHSLIGKIGENGTPFYVGSTFCGTTSTAGNLYLGMNDSYFRDNAGSLSVTIDTPGDNSDNPGTLIFDGDNPSDFTASSEFNSRFRIFANSSENSLYFQLFKYESNVNACGLIVAVPESIDVDYDKIRITFSYIESDGTVKVTNTRTLKEVQEDIQKESSTDDILMLLWTSFAQLIGTVVEIILNLLGLSLEILPVPSTSAINNPNAYDNVEIQAKRPPSERTDWYGVFNECLIKIPFFGTLPSQISFVGAYNGSAPNSTTLRQFYKEGVSVK